MSDDQNFTGPEFIPPEDGERSAGGDRPQRPQWVIPIALIGCGCIGLPLFLIVFGVLGLGNTLLRVYRSTGTHQVYQLASETVETDADVVAILGEPVEAGWASQSREAYEADEPGKVCMRFSVTGSDRSGSTYAEAQNIDGAWQLHQLIVNVSGETTPIAVMPLADEAQPLCPEFDAPDTEEEEILPDAGTEI